MGLFLYVNAVLREITNMSASRDRSVVRSSVIASAKYCWSGPLDRLAKGRTTIDSRCVDVLAVTGVCGLAATGACVETVGEFRFGHAHQAAVPMAITAAALAAITAGREISWRAAGLDCADSATSGVDATAAALIASTRT